MGYDAFGLPAENNAIKTGVPPREAVEASIAAYREQFRAWGVSFDWSREISSHDPAYYRWTQWIFLRLFERGLAYRAEAPVQWCPHRPDGARQRAGDRRTLRALRLTWSSCASSSSGSSGSPTTPTGCSTTSTCSSRGPSTW